MSTFNSVTVNNPATQPRHVLRKQEHDADVLKVRQRRFADDAQRAATAPDFVGQIGTQGARMFVAASTSGGAWTEFLATVPSETPVYRIAANRLTDAHAGWKAGDLVFQPGPTRPRIATVTFNAPFVGGYYEIIFHDHDGGTGFAGFPGGTSAVDGANSLAGGVSETVTDIEIIAVGNVVTFTSVGPINLTTPWSLTATLDGVPAPLPASVVFALTQTDLTAGVFLLVDATHLDSAAGYVALA